MFEYLASLDTEAIVVWGGGIGAGLTALGSIWQGIRKGRPTSPAALAAVHSATCRAHLLEPAIANVLTEVARLREEHDDFHDSLAALRDMMVRIEDRTRR